MTTRARSPQTPRAWCHALLRQLHAQAGLVRDAAAVEALLRAFIAQDPDAAAFHIRLEAQALGSNPEFADAARRILRAWDRHRAAAQGRRLEERPPALAADDEDTIRDLVASALEPRFDVRTASSGEAAQARAEPPALVLLDVTMPGMDGYAVARELRADPTTAGAKIVFITARGGIDARLAGREVGADGYIVKPLDVERLLAQAANLLGMDPLGL